MRVDFTTAAAPAAPGASLGRFYVVTGDRPGFRAGAAGAAEVLVTRDATETLTAKTLTMPTIADFTNAGHAHAAAASGGALLAANTHGTPSADTHHATAHGPAQHTDGTAWRVLYLNATGDETEFALGAANTFLRSNGVSSAPDFATPAGATTIRKSAAETVNNSSTLQNDDHFTFSIGASEIWAVDIYLDLTAANATADMQFTWTLPAGATMMVFGFGGDDGGFNFVGKGTTPGTGIAIGTAGGSTGVVVIHCLLVNSTNAGTAQFQWAQNVATVAALTLGINSYMIAHKI